MRIAACRFAFHAAKAAWESWLSTISTGKSKSDSQDVMKTSRCYQCPLMSVLALVCLGATDLAEANGTLTPLSFGLPGPLGVGLGCFGAVDVPATSPGFSLKS